MHHEEMSEVTLAQVSDLVSYMWPDCGHDGEPITDAWLEAVADIRYDDEVEREPLEA